MSYNLWLKVDGRNTNLQKIFTKKIAWHIIYLISHNQFSYILYYKSPIYPLVVHTQVSFYHRRSSLYTFVSRQSFVRTPGTLHNHPRIPLYYILYNNNIFYYYILTRTFAFASRHVIQFYPTRFFLPPKLLLNPMSFDMSPNPLPHHLTSEDSL